jgi:hypothetical protein
LIKTISATFLANLLKNLQLAYGGDFFLPPNHPEVEGDPALVFPLRSVEADVDTDC